MDHTVLVTKYLEILKDIDVSLLDRKDSHHPTSLSELFLPSIPEGYNKSKNRVMVVGAETRRWEVLKKDEHFESLERYAVKAMDNHRQTFTKFIEKKKSKGRSFFHFVKDVADRSGREGLIYSNLFCFSWNKGSPLKSPYLTDIKKYSRSLLQAQIDFFQPSIIVFANGISTAPVRREYFPHSGDNQVCTDSMSFEDLGIPKNQLWSFTLNNTIQCYRIQHPSARSSASAAARKFLVDLLPQK